MKTFTVLVGDPASTGNDAFGALGLQGTWPERKIYIRHAKQFWHTPYNMVANHFSTLQKKVKPDMILIEKNFDYDNVSKAFTHLPITYVTMSSDLTEKTRAKGWSVDKPYMIGWLQAEYKRHTIQYPKKQSADMAELINQQNEIVGITGPSGHTSYKRTRNRHDDLFTSKLIGCNAIRLWWQRQ